MQIEKGEKTSASVNRRPTKKYFREATNNLIIL